MKDKIIQIKNLLMERKALIEEEYNSNDDIYKSSCYEQVALIESLYRDIELIEKE